jgi:taurine dioxygenase
MSAWNSTIIDLLDHYGVVIFTGQSLTPGQYRDFAGTIGDVWKTDTTPGAATLAKEGSEKDIQVLSTANGLAYRTDIWHSDDTPSEEPTRYTFLHMQQMPRVGGDTMWSSQTAAFDALSTTMQGWLTGLTARHSNNTSRLPGNQVKGADHPVVIVHPKTGRRSLFVNPLSTERIHELSDEESANLLNFLYAHAVRSEFTCRWHWTVGDIAIWDNHFVQHYAIHDYGDDLRTIHRLKAQSQPLISVAEPIALST